MTKLTKSAPVVTEPSIKLSVDDFCVRLSETDRRVELVSAFCSVERQAGRVSDTADNYASRYQVFLNKPA